MRAHNALESKVWICLLYAWLLIGQQLAAIKLDASDPESVRQVSSQLAHDLVTFYTGNNTGDVPGNLPDPYYWWEAGAFFGALINYWAYTGDETYNAITKQAILHQAGSNGDLMPANQTRTEGNDDQSFWALTALMAAELGFSNPDKDQPSWLSMAQAVFNEQAARWGKGACNGGLKWQIYSFNVGWQYKNAISNGCFFDIAARLARYTGNGTYAEWAEKIWDWTAGVGLLGDRSEVFDGVSETNNCSEVNHVQWTYNNGVFMHGAAHMWNFTNGSSDKWKSRVTSFLNAGQIFFSHNESSTNVMYESACEMDDTCGVDQGSFKAYLGRWMGDVAKIAPFTYDTIIKRLRPSAEAAAAHCKGGESGTYCGGKWTTGSYDGAMGIGQQMSALEVVQVNLLDTFGGPMTGTTGGSSKGDASAGPGKSDSLEDPSQYGAITKKDQIGAGVLTVAVGIFVISVFSFMVF